jgi:hypothetical protein
VGSTKGLPSPPLWRRWNRALAIAGDVYLISPAGENLTFNRIVGRRIV